MREEIGRSTLRAEKVSEVAAAFDGMHDIHRAVEVGSVDAVIEAVDIRPRIIAEIKRGLPVQVPRTHE